MRKIEQRSLNLAKWANLLMGAAGIIAAIGSHAGALMLDGLFSGVNFLAAVMAGRVAASIQKKPSPMRPFGYEIDEPMYVMFRSLVLTGVIIVAGFGAAGKEVLGESAGADTVDEWNRATTSALAVTKLGRSQFAVAYIRPDAPASVEILDAIRDRVATACRSVCQPCRMEIIYTGTYPYA